jgi:hypothetical protein
LEEKNKKGVPALKKYAKRGKKERENGTSKKKSLDRRRTI